MLKTEELKEKLDEISTYCEKCKSSLTNDQKNLLELELNKVKTNYSCVQETDSKIQFHKKIIRDINKTSEKEVLKIGGIVLFFVVITLIFSGYTQFEIVSSMVIGGMIWFYYNNKKNNEIRTHENKINSLESTIEIFLRDISLQGVEDRLIREMLKINRLRDNLYPDEDTLEIKESDKPKLLKFNKISVIQLRQMELMTIKHLFPELEFIKNENEFDDYLGTWFYDSSF